MIRSHFARSLATLLIILIALPATAQNKKRLIPRAQTDPPGPPLSPAEAVKRMQVPEGFSVELVAAEPDIVNPIAMAFDDAGRVWVTESFEYPRSSAGKGRDRVKVLEDTDGDGRADKFTVFAEGLNIPSGIAVGYGGVWVANAPDILFMQDTDGDGRADKTEVIVTGFGRSDTHELPNSLTWGPDGWLYGLNGVFNHSHVKHRGKEYRFTCALFRFHPRTHDFELFAEGTSNPWGIAFDGRGSAFVSACVIDHLWHLTESGYYHRQGGPYPPFTWKIGSIVKHRHQKAAYCGIHYFDSDAYPSEYREKLYMGNIHGGCINSDELTRDGSTYFAKPRPDFLTANDAWFMPVVQKTGPDGCLYVLDWYDSYHCYQDARADPQGIDRDRGRLYRIRYRDTPRATNFDLARESDAQLIERLHSPNQYFRRRAGRLLAERDNPATRPRLERLVLDSTAARKPRMHALWALVATGRLDADFHLRLLKHAEADYRAWGVRAAGNFGQADEAIRVALVALADDPSPDVRLQVAIAARKLSGIDEGELLFDVLMAGGADRLLPHIVWQNLHPLLEDGADGFLRRLAKLDGIVPEEHQGLARMMPYLVGRVLARTNPDPAPLATLLAVLTRGKNADPRAAGRLLAVLARQVQTGELRAARLRQIRGLIEPYLEQTLAGPTGAPVYVDAVLLATTLGDARGIKAARSLFAAPKEPADQRVAALEALIAAGDDELLDTVDRLFTAAEEGSAQLRGRVIAALAQMDAPEVSPLVLKHYAKLEPPVKARAIELLTTRTVWAKDLLAAIGKKRIMPTALNVNQVRKLLAGGDGQTVAAVKRHWGTLRAERNPQREEVLAAMRTFLRTHRGDAKAGREVHKKVCGQCHKLHGQGVEVGPDITRNGRSSFEQLLSNVFDPSLVIGAAYQARTVVTTDGRVLTGLPVEEGKQRIVLKVQGGKQEVIPRDLVDEVQLSKLSMMPEGLEKQLKPQELSDLFAYLTLDRPPEDPAARLIPGTVKVDSDKLALPESVDNLLVTAATSSNTHMFGSGRRGASDHVIFDPRRGEFLRKSEHHEDGVAFGRKLGVVTESRPVWWMAEWKAPVEANLIVLSGAYPNQPQPRTAWKIELLREGAWTALARGTGGWYDNGRYVWGGPGTAPLRFDALRVSIFSPDAKTPLASVHFRGESHVSWVVANVPTDVRIER